MTTIAFIGLGAMGSGMAARLAASGATVRAFDLSDHAVARAVEAGCVAAGSVAEAAAGADAVVTMLPAGPQVRAVIEGEGGVLAACGPEALVIDCSTISVEDARAVAAAAAARGVAMVDAPVSGGVAAAAGGALTFMVGGADAAFARAEPILAPMAKAVLHAGAAGAGQAAKICNNMLLAVSMIGTCEAFALAERLDLDARRFFAIASRSSGQCWSMTSYAPVPGLVESAPSNRDFRGGFAAALMLKDLGLALEAATRSGASTPMAEKARELYGEYLTDFGADRDFSGIIDMLRDS